MGGFMRKALAGAGQGLAIVGQMTYQHNLASDLEAQRAEILAKRDAFLQTAEDDRLGKRIDFEKSEGLMNRQARLDEVKESGKAAATVKALDVAGDLEKENQKVVEIDGVGYVKAKDADGTPILRAVTKKAPKHEVVAEGAAVVDETGKPLYKNPKDPKAEGLDKTTKDIDDRIKMYKSFVTDYLGVDFLAKLDPAARPDYTKLLTNGSDQVRSGTHPEKAFRAQVEALDRIKARVSTPSGGSSNIEGIRKKFGF